MTLTARLETPWAELPAGPPFVLPCDAALVTAFNDKERQRRSDCERLQLELLPEPYIGRPDAPIVLLKSHAGYRPNDSRLMDDENARKIVRRNLLHQPLAYPFYVLDPALAWTDQAIWWRRKIRHVIAVSDERTVAENVLSIAAFPYRSFRNPALPGLLPSQDYAFALVEQAIDRNALILMGNTVRFWYDAVPRLQGYPHLFIARVARGGYITPGYYPLGFARLEELLREHGRQR